MKRNRSRIQQGRSSGQAEGPAKKKAKRSRGEAPLEDLGSSVRPSWKGKVEKMRNPKIESIVVPNHVDIACWSEVEPNWSRLSKELYQSGFPQAVKDSLYAIQLYFIRHAERGDSQLRNPEVVRRLAEEFVFGFRNRQALRDLVLVQSMSSCLESSASHGVEAHVFNALFPPEMAHGREDLLGQLVSLSISCKCSSALKAVAECLSICEMNVVSKVIIGDFCLLLPSLIPDLANTVTLAPSLVTLLLKSFTHIYPLMQKGVATPALCPPSHLLPVLADWLASDPFLCCQPRCSGSTLFVPYLFPLMDIDRWSCVSLPGLVRWTVLGPIILDSKANSFLSPLHTTVLKAAFLFQRKKLIVADASKGHFASDLLSIMRDLVSIVSTSRSADQTLDAIQLAIDRLAQAVQLMQASGMIEIKRSLRDMKDLANRLPANKLLQTVMAHWNR
eukprot:m.30668 g.30668  ORF g.30668 m.30668 type:complete len:446 (+) comp31376_c0_seq1:845-2182(+)